VTAREVARSGRVARVVALGKRIASPDDPLGQEARRALPAACNLSPEGVELALSRHLEADPTEEELTALVASCGRTPRCHVLLAANVCTAALRAVAIAVATAEAVVVRPSRRDPVLAVILARELSADAAFCAQQGTIDVAAQLTPQAGDELHIYGSDETVERLRGSAGEGVVIRAHGTGLGIALIGAGADLRAAAAKLADDVVPFDQRGCLSPRAAVVEGDADRAAAFAEALDEALRCAGERVPRGALDDASRAEIALYAAAIDAVGQSFAGPHHLVGLDLAPRALLLPPAARVVHVAPALAPSAGALIAPWARYITSMGHEGGGELAAAVARIAPWARRAPLGSMQRPPFDGPVDRRPASAAP
jgi:acyl-CoA reductase LuxC